MTTKNQILEIQAIDLQRGVTELKENLHLEKTVSEEQLNSLKMELDKLRTDYTTSWVRYISFIKKSYIILE